MSIGSVYQKLIRRRLKRQGFASNYSVIKGQRIHYLEGRFAGNLGTLVLIHGLGSNATSFSPILKRVASQFERVIAVDLLGHGLNDDAAETVTVQDVYNVLKIQLLEFARHEPLSIYGSSLGGGFALRFAAENPEAMHAIALVSPAGPPLRKKDVARIRRLFSISSPKTMRRFIEALFHRSPWYGSLLGRELRQAMERPIVRHIVKQLETIPALTPEDVLDMAVPILLVWGQSERVLPRRALEWYLRCLPDHAYIEQPFGYGHVPHLEVAEDLSARLLHFFRKSASKLPNGVGLAYTKRGIRDS